VHEIPLDPETAAHLQRQVLPDDGGTWSHSTDYSAVQVRPQSWCASCHNILPTS